MEQAEAASSEESAEAAQRLAEAEKSQGLEARRAFWGG